MYDFIPNYHTYKTTFHGATDMIITKYIILGKSLDNILPSLDQRGSGSQD